MSSSDFVVEFLSRTKVNRCIPLYETCEDGRICTAETEDSKGAISFLPNATSCDTVGFCVPSGRTKVTIEECVEEIDFNNIDLTSYPQCTVCKHGELCIQLQTPKNECTININKFWCSSDNFVGLPIIWSFLLNKCVIDEIALGGPVSPELCNDYRQYLAGGLNSTLSQTGYCPVANFSSPVGSNYYLSIFCAGNYDGHQIATDVRAQYWNNLCPEFTYDEFRLIDQTLTSVYNYTYTYTDQNGVQTDMFVQSCMFNTINTDTVCSNLDVTFTIPKYLYDFRHSFLNYSIQLGNAFDFIADPAFFPPYK